MEKQVTFEDEYLSCSESSISDDGRSTDSEGLYPIIVPEGSSKFPKFTLRLKNLAPGYGKQEIFDYFCEFSDKVIVSEEYSKQDKKHWHVYVENHDWEDKEQCREDIKEQFKITEGNKQYCLQDVKKEDSAKSYTVKDKDFLQQGFTDEEMDVIIAGSYKKYDKKTFASELEEIDKRYKETKDDRGWIYDFMSLKAKYKQVINVLYIKQRLRALKCSDSAYCANLAVTIDTQMCIEEGADPHHETGDELIASVKRLSLRGAALTVLRSDQGFEDDDI